MGSDSTATVRPRALGAAIAGGVLYAVLVLDWAFRTGIQFSGEGLTIVVGVGYASLGPFLIAAVPIYLLGRLSLVSPLLVAGWSLGNTVYLRWYVPRPHDALASYLTVWPLFVAIIVAVAVGEAVLRLAAARFGGRFGLRPVL